VLSVRECRPEEFLHRAGAWLEERETEHNLLLGIAGMRVGTTPARPSEPGAAATFFAVVEDGAGALVAAAAWTPPHPLVVSRATPDAVSALADSLRAAGRTPGGINAPVETAEAFATAWLARAGGSTRVRMRARIHETTRAIQPAGVKGRFRQAEVAHRALLIGWRTAFMREAVPGDPGETPEATAEVVDRILRAGTAFFWVDGATPVSMAVYGRTTRHGTCISGVFTPPEFRRRGFASACTAALAQCLLDGGKRQVCLFTDLANPTSNAIYATIGFRPVCDFLNLELLPPAPG